MTVLPRSRGRSLGVTLLHGMGLLPAALGELGLLARGDRAGAARIARRHAGLGDDGPDDGGVAVGGGGVDGARLVVHALLAAALGLVAWFLTWLAVVGTARGPFYGFVDDGPYDDSWGGPTLAGAWVAHAGVWVLVVVAWFLLVAALGVLSRRLTARLVDRDGPRWAVPVSAVIAAGAVVFVRAWLHQV